MSVLKRKLEDDLHVISCKSQRPGGDISVEINTDSFRILNDTSLGTNSTRSGLLKLPTELRLEVYLFLFRACQTYPKRFAKEGIARKHSALPEHVPTSPGKSKSARPDPPGTMIFKLTTDTNPPPYYQLGLARNASIILVNRQIYNEAQPMYWQYVTVKIRADSVMSVGRFLQQPNWNQNGQLRNLLIEPFKPRSSYVHPADFLFSGLRYISTNWSIRRLTLLLYLSSGTFALQPELDVVLSNLYRYSWIPEVEIAWHVTRAAAPPPLEELEAWLKRIVSLRGIDRKVVRPVWSTWYPEYSLVLLS